MIEKVVACSKEKKRRNGGKNTHSNALRSFRRSIASRWHRTTSSCILSQKHFSTNLSLLVRAIPVTTEPARREPPSYLAGGSRDTVCSSAKRRYRRLLHKRNAPVGGPDKSVWPLRSRCLCLGHNSRQGCAPRASLSLPSSLPHALAREWVRPRLMPAVCSSEGRSRRSRRALCPGALAFLDAVLGASDPVKKRGF